MIYLPENPKPNWFAPKKMKMKKNYPNFSRLAVVLFFIAQIVVIPLGAQVDFNSNTLDFNGVGSVKSGTSLMFGPDGRLYVAEYRGGIKIFTIQRNGPGDYVVTDEENLTVTDIQNHNDDGSQDSGTKRETLGLTVAGTAQNPIIYVTSSDFRVGGGSGGGDGDENLDTNSGVITRFTWNGSSWDVIDLVRGLPRSEENHATNGLELVNVNGTNYLIVASGGHTNGGAPSTNFAYLTEYALSAAVISVNLDMINAMTTQFDDGRAYKYDLPTLDDPTRDNVNGITDPDAPGYDGIDINDPFGGNDGLNQAKIDPTGPVQIFSPGYRNSYDLVITESGAVYITDNGPNQNWGGLANNEGTAAVDNNYVLDGNGNESGGSLGTAAPDGEYMNNKDHLHVATTDISTYTFGSFYGGHPTPIRANPAGAGLFTAPEPSGTNNAVFRTLTYDPDGSRPGSTTDASIALPADWPPVPIAQANPVEGDWRGSGLPNPDGAIDDLVTIWPNNTNGIDEYTSSQFFSGAMQGDLIAGNSDGILFRVQVNPDGSLSNLTELASGLPGITNLGITCNSDSEIFPGTIWVAPFSNEILVLEPQDTTNCLDPSDPDYEPDADYDGDGYTNQDEEDNETDPCNGGSRPNDFDASAGGTLVSDLNDTDDDADGILDADDPFQIGDPTVSGSDAFPLPVDNELLNGNPELKGFAGLGLTGLMNNGDPNPNWLLWLDRTDDPNDPNGNDILGGATGLMTMQMTPGTAFGNTNTQEKGFQYGIQTDQNTGIFTVRGAMSNFNTPTQLYGNTEAPNGELGLFIGDGTQSNYIKFVITQDGLVAQQEIGDSPQTALTQTIATQDRPNGAIAFYFVVDASTGEITFQYEFDASGVRETLGTLTAQGSILAAIQQSSTDLAVGMIGTSNASGVELEGTWESLDVLLDEPFIVEVLPDINQFVNAPEDEIELTEYFDDDFGAENLLYTVFENTDPTIGAAIVGSVLTITYPPIAATSDITIRATDGGGLFVDQTFRVDVSDSPTILYRVNSGGPAITSIDGNMDWGADDPRDVISPYLSEPGGNQASSVNINSHTYTSEANVGVTTPEDIFRRERFDGVAPPEMAYSFPVAQSGNYEIRLYLANGFSGTSEPGERIFSVEIEGTPLPLLTDLDLSATYGHQVGTMISHVFNVTDGAIDIEFLHGAVQNPIVNGIEILDVSDANTPIYVFQLPDQRNDPGEELDGSLGPQTTGGDGNLFFSATGLPSGLFVDPSNGQIGGTISPTADENSPYFVTYTIDDDDGISSDAVMMSFTWVVEETTIFRINSGGEEVTAGDQGPSWEDNSQNSFQQGDNYSVNVGITTGFGTVTTYENRDSSVPAYIDESTFNTLFQNERFDPVALPEMEYNLPLGDGDYVVNLYLGNSFSSTSQIGDRVFDIFIEGALVENDFDMIAAFGNEVGGMLTYPVTVSDGELNIEFGHVVENPSINAIEVFIADQSLPVLTLNPIADQQSSAGEEINFTVSASGGDTSRSLEYYIAGQPSGISINLSSGNISGTVDSSALVGGPNGDGIHQVKVTIIRPGSAPQSQTFQWDVSTTWVDKDEDENYTGRHECSFVQAGDKFYLMGGRENSRTIDVYDYATNTWNSLNNSAPFSFNHFQAIEYGGLIWVIGAFTSNNFPNEPPAESIWMFNPATNEWIEGATIPEARRRGGAGVVMYNDKFYISGGNTIGHNGGYVAWFDEFDPATGVWTPLADMPRERDHFHAVVIDDKLYAAGGRLSGGMEGTFKPTISEVDIFDFATGTWSTLSNDIPTPRGGSTSAVFNNKLIVMGGEVFQEVVYGTQVTDALPITEQFDPVTGQWTRLADMNHERHGTQAIASGDGVFIIAGSPKIGGGPEGNQKNMEFYGQDNPQGEPSVASTLTAPSSVFVANNASQDFDITISGGNVGEFIKSMEITGPDAGDFTITQGELNNAFIQPQTTQTVTISLDGNGTNRSATLTIRYGEASTAEIILTNTADFDLNIGNPGNQYNYEGDAVSLQIEATSVNTITNYSASGLPPDLTINSNTGEISGTISEFQSGDGPFLETNGFVMIEAESGVLEDDWSQTVIDGKDAIIAGSNHFGNQNGGTIQYPITITEPGIYRVNWSSAFTGGAGDVTNDSWLRFPNTDDVWFFAQQFAGGLSDAEIIANLQGDQNNVLFPVGSSRVSPETTPEGQSGSGFFKVFRSGCCQNEFKWQAVTSDGDGHRIYVWFVNPGTYNMEISERSQGHAIDRVTVYRQNGPSYSDAELDAAAESNRGSGLPGASDNSPYSVTVTVEDDGNPAGSESVTFNWIIGLPGELISAPEADPIQGNAPLEVQFTGTNSLDDVGVTSYFWDFDDGNTSTEADPTHIFTDVGTYDVELTVEDIDGNSDTNSVTVVVTEANNVPPIAVITADPLSGNAPLQVGFTGSGSTDDETIVSYSWDFKDGGTSTEADPLYVFTIPGVYDVELTVEDNIGLTDTETITITVGEPNAPPVAVVMATPLIGDAPLLVEFVGSGSTDDNAVVSYLWNFKDGGTSTEADPTHTFTTPGIYEVDLTVEDAEGLTDTTSVTITVEAPNQPPVAVVTANPEVGDAPLEVSFTGSGSTDDEAVVSYSWVFGDGGTSSDTDPTYTYTTPGTYTAALTVEDGEGLTNTTEVTITVNVPNQPPVAVVTATPEQGMVPLEVMFTGSGSTDDVAIVSYAWDFDDGGTSTEADPTYTFNASGTYQVTLTVTDEEGLEDTANISITVEDPNNSAPIAIASANPTEGEAPLAVIFNGSASTDDFGIVSYFWDFQDGTTSEEINPVTTFDIPGVYDVTLTVTDAGGLSNTDTVTITVSGGASEAPEAVVGATPLSGDAPLEVGFTGSNSTDDVAIVSYLWDFMDGGTSTDADPVHTFTAIGDFLVTLTVTDGDGQTDTGSITISVSAPTGTEAPVAVASADPVSGDVPLVVNFTGSNSTDDVGIVSYAWDFMDGNTATEADPTHTFMSADTYEVMLTVTDDDGLTDFEIVTITVTEPSTNEDPVAIASATPLSGDVPLEVNFTGDASTDDNGIVAYSWDFDDGDTSTESNPTHTFTFAGTFEVQLTVEDAEGATDTATVTIEVQDNTTQQTGDLVMSVAPNPATRVAQLYVMEMPEDVVVTKIHLHDSTGRLLGSFEPQDVLTDGFYELPIGTLRDGLYYLQIEMNNGDPVGIRLLIEN